VPSRWSTDAIPQRPVVLSTTRRRPHPFRLEPPYLRPKIVHLTHHPCPGDPSPVSVPGLKKCAVAPSGAEACWELWPTLPFDSHH
jgi:hypothetical protein